MIERTINFLQSISFVAFLILFIGKVTEKIAISWWVVPYPILIFLSLFAIYTIFSHAMMGWLVRKNALNKEDLA